MAATEYLPKNQTIVEKERKITAPEGCEIEKVEMKILYKYAILPIATGEVYDAVKSGKWIADRLAEQLLLEIDELRDKPKKAIRLSVVAEWPEKE